MNSKEILKSAFDMDLEVLKQAYKSDEDLLNIVQIITTSIWTTLILKGIITKEEMEEMNKMVKEQIEVNKDIGDK